MVYFGLVSTGSRNLLPLAAQRLVASAMSGHVWPALTFMPRRVRLGRQTDILLTPHIGEFDERSLYSRDIEYEAAVFAWMEDNAAKYDLIIEIGANVGIYTVFLDTVRRRRPQGPSQTIVSFEPAAEPFRRLQRNLEANGARVIAFQAAVGATAGLRDFYEPVGHLTNGSFVREFAAHFAGQLERTTVVVVAAADLEKWLVSAQKALIKIDVEGYEPELLAALGPLLEMYRPDLLIEVMPGTAGPLQADATLARYERFLLTRGGLQAETTFFFSPSYFDWFLTWRT
jgi:FkbM family methyltransferase